MTTLAKVRDFGSTALDFGWERRKQALFVAGGIAVLGAVGYFVTRLLRGRAGALAEEVTDHVAGEVKNGIGKMKGKQQGAGSAGTMAHSAKL